MERSRADSPSASAALPLASSAHAGAASTLSAQAQQETTEERRHLSLSQVKPDLGGFRDGVFIQPDPIEFEDHTGYHSIFDGKTLTDWHGHPDVWSVQDGLIVGETTLARYPHTFPNTFLVYHGAEAKDFDLKLEIMSQKGGGSGIQYRSTVGNPGATPADEGGLRDPRWQMMGPQADFWYPVDEQSKAYTGQLYSQNDYRGIIVWRGQVVRCLPGKLPRLIAMIDQRTKLGASVRDGDWNQYLIIARGPVMLHILNGQLMAVLVDDDPASSNNISGLFGLQAEGVPCRVSFRNLWLKKLA